MVAGLVIKLTGSTFIQNVVSFDYLSFFNLLLPPIILASGYELHQVCTHSSSLGHPANTWVRPTSSAILAPS